MIIGNNDVRKRTLTEVMEVIRSIRRHHMPGGDYETFRKHVLGTLRLMLDEASPPINEPVRSDEELLRTLYAGLVKSGWKPPQKISAACPVLRPVEHCDCGRFFIESCSHTSRRDDCPNLGEAKISGVSTPG